MEARAHGSAIDSSIGINHRSPLPAAAAVEFRRQPWSPHPRLYYSISLISFPPTHPLRVIERMIQPCDSQSVTPMQTSTSKRSLKGATESPTICWMMTTMMSYRPEYPPRTTPLLAVRRLLAVDRSLSPLALLLRPQAAVQLMTWDRETTTTFIRLMRRASPRPGDRLD